MSMAGSPKLKIKMHQKDYPQFRIFGHLLVVLNDFVDKTHDKAQKLETK